MGKIITHHLEILSENFWTTLQLLLDYRTHAIISPAEEPFQWPFYVI